MKKQVKHEELQIIGLNVRKIRESQGISRLQLAFEIGTTERHLARIESGEVNSGIINFIKLSKSLNVPIYILFDKLD